MDDAKPFPWDFDPSPLRKGDAIRIKQLQRIVGHRYGTCEYQQQLMVFQGQLQKWLWDDDRRFTLRIKAGDLLILTDAEAAEYNRNRFDLHRKGLFRSHRRSMAVDTRNLGVDESREHGRSLVVQGAILTGIGLAKQEVRAVVHQRRNPGLMEPAADH